MARAVLLLWAVALSLGASAQARAQSSAPLVVVVQAGLGGDNGDVLRGEITKRFGVDAVALTRAEVASARPRAVLAVSVSEKNVLSVLYWDAAGGFDSLSVPAPAAPQAALDAALTLASALVQRHLEAIRAPAVTDGAPAPRPAAVPIAPWRTTRRLAIALAFDDF